VPKLLDSMTSVPGNTATGSTGRFAILTPREVEVTRLIAEGESNKHIARYLAITERTERIILRRYSARSAWLTAVKLAVLAARRR